MPYEAPPCCVELNHGGHHFTREGGYFRFRRRLVLSFPRQGRGARGCAALFSERSSSILVAAATPAPATAMTEQMTLRGTLKGHNGWVTQIATTPQFPDMILSASRGTGLRCVSGLANKGVARVLAARKTGCKLAVYPVPRPQLGCTHRDVGQISQWLLGGLQGWGLLKNFLLRSLQVCLSVPRSLRVG